MIESPLLAKKPNLTPEIWHLEDGTPIYMYSIEAFYYFRDQSMKDTFHANKSRGSVFLTQHSTGSHKKHSHIS